MQPPSLPSVTNWILQVVAILMIITGLSLSLWSSWYLPTFVQVAIIFVVGIFICLVSLINVAPKRINDWRKPSSDPVRAAGYLALGLGIFIAILGSFDLLPFSKQIIDNFYSNTVSELISISITILIIERLDELRSEQRKRIEIIEQMGSKVRTIALEASRLAKKYDLSLRGANLREAALIRVDLDGADLREADLGRANLTGANLVKANLKGANLEGATLKDAHMMFIILEDATLKNPNGEIKGANLEGANLEQAKLRQSDLSKANLITANLKHSDASDAKFIQTNLERANLERANLERVNFSKANLQGANLEKANLMGANLEGANLNDVNFRGTNLKNAVLKNCRLDKFIFDETTIWPENFTLNYTYIRNISEEEYKDWKVKFGYYPED